MLRIIERLPLGVIQKITKPNGELIRYQAVLNGCAGDTAKVQAFTTLTDARLALGLVANQPKKVSGPNTLHLPFAS